MELTPETKKEIDSKSYGSLLSRWRSAPIGDPWFQGQTGDYWGKRMREMRKEDGGQARHVAASKAIGFD